VNWLTGRKTREKAGFYARELYQQIDPTNLNTKVWEYLQERGNALDCHGVGQSKESAKGVANCHALGQF
jgi:hypothetical protein